MTPAPDDLLALAERILTDHGFLPYPDPTTRQAADDTVEPPTEGVRDLRGLLWSSVDNASSRDLDQIEVAERLPDGDTLLRVAIADVDAWVSKDSLLDRRAATNTVTVYAGITSFPLLPRSLSEGHTSLLPDTDRLALVTELKVNPDGTLERSDCYRARVRNRARLSYESVGPWLQGTAPLPPEIAVVPGLEAQVRLQIAVADRFAALRRQAGALEFETVEASPVVVDGRVVDLTVIERSPARALIESFMIAVNVAIAHFLAAHGRASIQRVVTAPRRWDRIVALAAALGETLPPTPDSPALGAFLARRRAADPRGYGALSLAIVKLLGPGEYVRVAAGAPPRPHFGLAVQGYTHSTAPNRRYCDLITQRLVKAALDGAPAPYTDDDLQAIARHCTERAQAANAIERTVRKAAAALLLSDRIGETFLATVTGVKATGTWARLDRPGAEGRIMNPGPRLDVGDRLKVRLLRTDPQTGHIDFEALSTR
jgi:exoribonuclease-2